MQEPIEILELARKEPIMHNELELLHQRKQRTPGSVQYSINRYRKMPQWGVEDIGMLVYNREAKKHQNNYLELRFCITGNLYCQEPLTACQHCKYKTPASCSNKQSSIDVLSFVFSPSHLSQFSAPAGRNQSYTEDVVRFNHQTSFSKTIQLCSRTRAVLDTMLNNEYAGSMENIFLNAQMQMLLLYSLECMVGEREEMVFSCKFLANEADREKIEKAREVLLQHIGEPITIKELSRKVAINECYLKKGFKEMYGTTVFDFYQVQRMEHARYLLYEKGLSVTEVSLMLGYSSISHFSTAFKKHTGIKPCELLLR